MRGLQVTAAAALALALLAGLLLASLSLGFGREALRRALEAELARSLALPVRIGALEGPLFPALALRDFAVGDAGAPLAAADRLALRLDGWALLRERRLVFAAVEAEGARLRFERGVDGSWTGPGIGAGGAGTGPALAIRSLTLSGARLELHWQEAGAAQHATARVELRASDLVLPWTAEAARAAALRLDLALEPAVLPRARLEGGELALELSDGQLSIARGALETSAGRLRLEGGASLSGAPATGELTLRFEALDVAAWSGRPGLAGALAGRADLALRRDAGAPLAATELNLTLAVERSTLALLREARLRGGVRQGSWRLEECELAGEGLDVSAEGRGTREAIETLRVAASVAQIERFARPGETFDLRGDLRLDAQVAGAFDRPEAHVSLAGERLALRGVSLGQLRAELRSTGEGRVRVEALSLEGGALPLRLEAPAELRVTADGVASDGVAVASGPQRLSLAGAVGRDGFAKARIEARALDTGVLARLLEAPVALAGAADLELALDGPLARPALSGELRWSQPRVDETGFESLVAEVETQAGSLSLRAQLRDADRELAHVVASLPYGPGPLGAGWLASPETRLELRAEAFELALLAPLLPDAVRQLRGPAQVDLELRGGDPPSARGSFLLQDGALRLAALGHRFAPLRVALQLVPNPVGFEIAELEIESQGQSASVRGVVTSRELRDVHVEAKGLEVARIAPWFGAPDDWSGRADLELELDGRFAAPRVSGRASWLEARIGDLPLETVDAEVSTEGDAARAELRVREAGAEVLHVQASAPFPLPPAPLADSRVHLEARGEGVELAILRPFLRGSLRDLAGRAELSLDLRGGSPEPVARGSLVLADASVRVPLLRQTFAPIRGRLELEPDALVVSSLELGPPQGAARLTGRIALDALEPRDVDLALTLHALQLARHPALRSDVSGEVRVSGPPDALRLVGDLAVADAAVSLRDESDAALKEIRVLANGTSSAAGELREEPTAPGVYQRASVDLRLAVPRNTWVRGPGTELEIHGNLRLHKDPLQDAVLIGSAEVVRGRYTFQTKRFDVRSGTATWDGGTALDPLLDVVAAHPVGDVTVLVYLTGRASAPTIRLGSEPAGLSESDALSYLFLGRPADQLGSEEQRGLESAAAGLAAGVAATQAAQLITQALPLDTVDVRMNEQGRPAELKVGKYVTDRIFVRYGRTLGPDPQDEVRVELRLSPHWSVGTEVSSDDSAGADVIWSLDY